MKLKLVGLMLAGMLIFAPAAAGYEMGPQSIRPFDGETFQLTPKTGVTLEVTHGPEGGTYVEVWRASGAPLQLLVGPGYFFKGVLPSAVLAAAEFQPGGALYSGPVGTVYWRPYATCEDESGRTYRCDGLTRSFVYELVPEAPPPPRPIDREKCREAMKARNQAVRRLRIAKREQREVSRWAEALRVKRQRVRAACTH